MLSMLAIGIMDQLLQATALAERDHFWFKGFRRFMAPLLAEAVRSRQSPRILDCGCGTGRNLECCGNTARRSAST